MTPPRPHAQLMTRKNWSGQLEGEATGKSGWDLRSVKLSYGHLFEEESRGVCQFGG